MSEYISKEEAIEAFSDMSDGTPITHGDMISDTTAVNVIKSISSADVRENIHGHWERMSDLPEDKDDRYKCSRCGNVVHHSNGVNLYHFNSWCGRCGSLNNSLIAGSEPKGEKGTE